MNVPIHERGGFIDAADQKWNSQLRIARGPYIAYEVGQTVNTEPEVLGPFDAKVVRDIVVPNALPRETKLNELDLTNITLNASRKGEITTTLDRLVDKRYVDLGALDRAPRNWGKETGLGAGNIVFIDFALRYLRISPDLPRRPY